MRGDLRLGERKDHAGEVLAEAEAFLGVGPEDAGHAGAEVFHHIEVAEDAHEFLVAGDGVAFEKLGFAEALRNAAGGGDFQAISKELKLGDSLVAVVVVDDGIDHGLTQGYGIEQAGFLALF